MEISIPAPAKPPSTASPFMFPLFSIPSWMIYLYTVLAAVAVAVVITVIVLEQRNRKQISPRKFAQAVVRQ